MTITPKAIAAVVAGIGAVVGGVYHFWSKQTRQEERVVILGRRDSSFCHTEKQHDVSDGVTEAVRTASGQADSVVIDIVRARRIDRLMKKLAAIDHNRAGAEEEFRQLKKEIEKLLLSNRGTWKGIHGFIGETAQVHVSNIKAFINGNEPLYVLLDDNSMTDYTRGLQIIQQKACQSDGYLGLTHIRRHKETYPDFLKKDGIYHIPKDMYEEYKRLRDLPESIALKLRKEDLRLWRYIRSFTAENPDVRIESMDLTYADIQAGNINDTLKRIERDARRAFKKQYDVAEKEHAPSTGEFLKLCGIAAAMEGVVGGFTEFTGKIRKGKRPQEFNTQDIKDIAASTIICSGKGALRGGIVYLAVNFLKAPASIVSGAVTAVYGIFREGYSVFCKKKTKVEFLKEALRIIFETTMSTGGAIVGKKLLKKYPVIGALAGSIVGSAGTRYLQRVAY